jgi:hypothetical protein
VCARYEVVPNESIQRYCGNKYIKFNTWNIWFIGYSNINNLLW